jgi:hypothetical protein
MQKLFHHKYGVSHSIQKNPSRFFDTLYRRWKRSLSVLFFVSDLVSVSVSISDSVLVPSFNVLISFAQPFSINH